MTHPSRRHLLSAAAATVWGTRASAAPSSRLESITHQGILVRDCTIPGETRQDDVTPAHPNGIPASKNRWLLIYATRAFRGVDDDTSIVYQIRDRTPDGPLIKEGYLVRSRSDWDPLGDGRPCIMQHGHPVLFGVPRGTLAGGKPAPSANVFVAKWRKVARRYDKVRKYVEHGSADRELSERTQAVEWMQFRLNRTEDGIEVIQPVAVLRQKGHESGPICGAPVKHMNQSFTQAVPYTRDGTEWADCNHFDGRRVAALKYRYNPKMGRYEWTQIGPLAGGPGNPIGEASLARYGERWVISARRERGAAWVLAEDPFGPLPAAVLPAEPATNVPLTAYTGPDGVLRLFTGDRTISPYQNGRDPLYCWEVDPDASFGVSNRRVVYDSVKAGLPIRPGASPKVDMCKLLPHAGGRVQYLIYRVSIRAFNHPYVGSAGVVSGIPIANAGEKAACAIYYAKITYTESFPSLWEFAA